MGGAGTCAPCFGWWGVVTLMRVTPATPRLDRTNWKRRGKHPTPPPVPAKL